MQNKYKWNETNYKTITSTMFAHIFNLHVPLHV